MATDQPPPPIHVGEYIPRDRERVPDSLAKKRGKDWGLPGSARNSISITRPVRLQCYGDRLVIYGEQGGAATAKNVPLGARTEDCVEALVSSMWERIGAWGLAGQGMYWRPIMQVEVMPGGEQRFAELESLFRDSGLDMQQRNTPYAPSQNALHEQIER